MKQRKTMQQRKRAQQWRQEGEVLTILGAICLAILLPVIFFYGF